MRDAWMLADDLRVVIYERTRSFREGKRDYPHFLYIARGSLAEAQYFIHLAKRLHYLSETEEQDLLAQTKVLFSCLHGLIQAVEREAGKIGKTDCRFYEHDCVVPGALPAGSV